MFSTVLSQATVKVLVRHGRRSVADDADIIGGNQVTDAGVERVDVRYLAAGRVHEERRPSTSAVFQLSPFLVSSRTWTTVDVVGSKESDQQQRQNDGGTHAQTD